MARPAPQPINCPQCSQPFNAFLEQILDVGMDPTAKERLLSGRVNTVTCPHCGFQGMVGTPLMYHDADKQLAIIYVPMELNLETQQREMMVGEMTRAVMMNMTEESPKGYLLQPNMALTMQGLIDQVLEADGITKEMMDAERHKVELLDTLASAESDEVDDLLEENAELIDRGFLELLTMTAQAASERGDGRVSLRLLNVRKKLMDTTEAGREMKKQEDALKEASQELQALGEGMTREKFVELIVEAADNPDKIQAYGMLGRTILDYSTFQELAKYIDDAEDEDRKQQLIDARESLLAVAAEYEQQSRAVVERAVDTLRMLLSSPDINTAIQNNLDRIDQTFLDVLQANLEEARRTGQIEVSSRLGQIHETVMAMIQASAPPEIQFLNAVVTAGTDDDAKALLDANADQISEDLLTVMAELVGQLRMAGNDAAADRLEMARNHAATLV